MGKCARCRGEGSTRVKLQSTCSTCCGSQKCTVCKGTGKTGAVCAFCGGSGECRHCDGRGSVPYDTECKQCIQGQTATGVVCSACNGTGTLSRTSEHRRCKGSGKCVRCGGTGASAASAPDAKSAVSGDASTVCTFCTKNGKSATGRCSSCKGYGVVDEWRDGVCPDCGGLGHNRTFSLSGGVTGTVVFEPVLATLKSTGAMKDGSSEVTRPSIARWLIRSATVDGEVADPRSVSLTDSETTFALRVPSWGRLELTGPPLRWADDHPVTLKGTITPLASSLSGEREDASAAKTSHRTKKLSVTLVSRTTSSAVASAASAPTTGPTSSGADAEGGTSAADDVAARARAAFAVCDLDGNGAVEVAELTKVLDAMGTPVPAPEAGQLVLRINAAAADAGARVHAGGKKITVEAFVRGWAVVQDAYRVYVREVLPAGVVTEMNAIRTDPLSYIRVLEDYRALFEGKRCKEPGQATLITNEGVAPIDETIEELKALDGPLPRLRHHEGLAVAAAIHATDLGRSGTTGHYGTDGSRPAQRISRCGTWGGLTGENISFGPRSSREIVRALLVDDGVASRGHRKTILNPEFAVVGVASSAHCSWGFVSVHNFAAKFTAATSLPAMPEVYVPKGAVPSFADANAASKIQNFARRTAAMHLRKSVAEDTKAEEAGGTVHEGHAVTDEMKTALRDAPADWLERAAAAATEGRTIRVSVLSDRTVLKLWGNGRITTLTLKQ
eukprot:TRINITY_DN44514_c0_g1_i1.p1 TRINITY_DN44514_c0_g1~~TRINITY_DN44514_c0_g1_i1.p1  ORF type:complete len:729 (+),score=125.26 TRINITY_DN44514_c0_g1_i1:102-2288(+)